MAQPRYACRTCGVWQCTACPWKRPAASVWYPDQFCGRCGSAEGTMTPTMHTALQWKRHNDDEELPLPWTCPAPEPRVAARPPEMYRGVMVPKQGPYQRLDLASWKRGVDDCMKRFPTEEGER